MKSRPKLNLRCCPQADVLTMLKISMGLNQKRGAVAMACLLLALSAAQAGPLTLSSGPPSNGGSEPAPNVILTVDDSGSMDWDVTTDNDTSTTANKKITLLKNSLKAEFGDGTANSGKIPDGRIRLAWQALHNNGSSSGAGSLTPGATNAMRSFTGAHRTNFNSFVNSLSANNGTPSLKMMRNVYDYARTPAGIDSPWADTPGTAQTTPYLACRRTYHVFMTDGAWNSQSNTNDRVTKGDSVTQTLPDGTVYDITSSQVKVYTDAFGDTNQTKASTLSDFAFKNWATDMQDGTGSTQNMPNGSSGVRPLIKQTGSVVFSKNGAGANLACVAANNCITTQQYWNPKNDPATWQHVIQYTIGFGLGAVNWPYRKAASDSSLYTSTTSSNINARTTPADWDYNNTARDNYGGDFGLLVQGQLVWPDVYAYDTSPSSSQQDQRTVELWHAALNGRGRYYPAKTAADLTQAFADIMGTVIADTSQPLVSVTTSSSYLRAGMSAFIAGYSADKWFGLLKARAIDPATGAVSGTDTWNASALLDDAAYSVANRFVLSYNGSAGFSWKTYSGTAPILPTAQQTPMNRNSGGTVDNRGQARVDYIRGDRTQEVQNGGIYRDRNSRLGDVVNSNIWYATDKGGRIPMVYVGANDGMLHGLAAATTGSVPGGTELLAYIPRGIAEGSLRDLTDTTYTHKYFVDASPFTGDAYISGAASTTVLVGTLGNGGKGYFVLDATNPANFTVNNAANLVITDTTGGTVDADIGFITSPPTIDESGKSSQIVRLNNGRWALVLGNGYNSSNLAPVLIIQYLDGDKSIKKLSPCSVPIASTACSFKGSNGLSGPLLVDLNGNGTADVAYAGDLQGNLWKFNLSSATDASWGVSYSGQPFFVAKGGTTIGARPAATVVQPITTAPYWMPHKLGGIMVAVGTGENLTVADQSSTSIDSYYALWDNSTFTSSSAGILTITDGTVINTTGATTLPATLVQQTITGALTDAGVNYYTSSSNAVDYSTNFTASTANPIVSKRGWYMDWSIAGQRVLTNTRIYSQEQIVVQTTIPKSGTSSSGESCTVSATAERSFLSLLNMFTGEPAEDLPFALTTTTVSNPNTAVTGMEVDSDTALVRNGQSQMVIIKATSGGTGGSGSGNTRFSYDPVCVANPGTPGCQLPPTDPICIANPADSRCLPPKDRLSFTPHLGRRVGWRNQQ
jgi:type IV pilus assembly protein PilY1